ncbi:MAG: hypothetical protein U0353_27575 [Sandaracinus sp.]
MSPVRVALACSALALGLAGCPGPIIEPDAETGHDAGTREPDAAVPTDASTDAGLSTGDAGSGGTSVLLTEGAMSATLDRAFLGYERTGTEITALYVELSRGADGACPSETSPVPQQIITVDHIALTAPGTVTEADGVAARFFDFEGTLRMEIAPANSTSASVEVTALDLVAGTADATISLVFDDGGTAAGSFHATHCDSLDVMP